MVEAELGFDLSACYLLFVHRLQHLVPAANRRLGERLALTQLQQDFRFFELLFILL